MLYDILWNNIQKDYLWWPVVFVKMMTPILSSVSYVGSIFVIDILWMMRGRLSAMDVNIQVDGIE